MNILFHSFLRRCFVLLALILASVQARAANDADFVTQSVPASMNAGQPYSVSVTMKNVGSTTWTPEAGFKLGSQNPVDNWTWGDNRVLLSGPVAPGSQHTFAATILAPPPGVYNFRWQMGQENVEWFGDMTDNVEVTVGTGNNARYISQSVPTSVNPGQSFPVSIVMENNGVTTWTPAAGHKLGAQDTTWGASRMLLSGPVAPGQRYTFGATLVAPTTPGIYNFQWQMGQELVEWFGTPSAIVAVNVAQGPPVITVTRSPTTMVAGRAFTLNWGATGATTLSRGCTASGTGFTSSTTTFTLSGNSGGTAITDWVGNPSTCTWSATGPGGSATITETMTTVLPPPPVVTVTRTPAPMVSGQSYTVTWSATDATSISRTCTSSGTGYAGTVALKAAGSETALAEEGWVGFPSNCTWTATGYGGNGSKTETMTTLAGPAITYFHNDVSGTPMLATNASGNVVWKETYQPYGNRINNQAAATSNNKLWFTGKPHDANTGLSYMGARYYDPVIGRFMGVDPVDFQEENIHSFNRYAYANNNPYKFVDPDGRIPIPAAIAAIGAVATRVMLWFAARQAGTIMAAETAAAVATGAVVPSVALEGVAAKVTATELRVAGQADFQAARAGKLAENGGMCTYCTVRPATEVDHVKSLKAYADDVNAGKLTKSDAAKQANAESNLAPACSPCNRGPGGKHAKELGSEPGPGKWVAPNGFKKD